MVDAVSGRSLVLYHANCADGFCAAWIAHRRFGAAADYLPVQYGQEPPDVAGRNVFILDFSYKRPVMLRLCYTAASMTVLDHHKTAQADLDGLDSDCRHRAVCVPRIVFDMEKSGGRLTWEHFFPNEPAPWLVRYTEDRDLWRWQLPHSKEISAALASHPKTFELWDRWNMTVNGGNATPTLLAEEGAAILRYQVQLVDAIASTAREHDLDGHKVLAANTSCLFSEVAEKLAEGRPFGAAWFIRADGKRQWSLRSRDGGVDVSDVAKRRGGGGHRAAAGFEESLP